MNWRVTQSSGNALRPVRPYFSCMFLINVAYFMQDAYSNSTAFDSLTDYCGGTFCTLSAGFCTGEAQHTAFTRHRTSRMMLPSLFLPCEDPSFRAFGAAMRYFV